MAENVRFSPRATQDVAWMSPDQYLDMMPEMDDPKAGPQAKALRESLQKGDPVDEAPSFTIKDGKIAAQDGRHRALAAKKAGIRSIPVRIEGDIPDTGVVTDMRGKAVTLNTENPKKWAEVIKSDAYQALKPQQKDQARQQYFHQVIAPRVSKADMGTAWGQFDRQTRASVPPTAYDPTEGMTTGQRVAAGAGKAVHDVLLGGRSMLPEALGGTAPGEVEETRQMDAPLMNTTAGSVGNFFGNAGMAIPTAFLPGANTVLGSALYGGAMGALQPAETGGERLGNAASAGLMSGGGTMAARAVPSIYRALVDPFVSSGQNRVAMDVLGKFAKDPQSLSELGPTELIPGSRASLAEVTGDPGIAQLQRTLQASSTDAASDFAQIRTDRLAARRNALTTLTGEPGAKDAAEAARGAEADRLYGEAFNAPLDPEAVKAQRPALTSLMERPAMQKAGREALRIAKDEGENLTAQEMQTGTVSVKGLHYIKKAMDEAISKARVLGDDAEERRLMKTQGNLLNVLDGISPAYKTARTAYETASKPINQMEIGEYLYKKLVPALSDFGAERLTPQNFAQALREGDAMAKKATGFPGAKLADVLSQEQHDMLLMLGLDLGREAWAAEAGAVRGSPTAQYLTGKNALRRIMGPLGLPESWSESVLADVVANRWMSLAAKPIESRIMDRLSSMVADPSAYLSAKAAQDASALRVPLSVLSNVGQRVLPPLAIGNAAFRVNQANAQQ